MYTVWIAASMAASCVANCVRANFVVVLCQRIAGPGAAVA